MRNRWSNRWTGLLLAGCVLGAHAQVQTRVQTQLFPDLAGGSYNLPIASLKQSRVAGTVLQRFDFSCGSAAVATLLTHHYGFPVTEQMVLEKMYADGDQVKIRQEGFSLLDMKRYLEGLGFAADGFQQPLDKLLEARVPAVVLVNDNGYLHFVVVKGLQAGPHGQRVLVGDPARGTRAIAREAFEASWVGGLLFVIHNRMEQARFNQPSDWQSAPRAPLPVLHGGVAGVAGVAGMGLAKHGPGGF